MKPLASLSLDLDNQWAYMRTHGDAGWETFPSYLDRVVPRVLNFLKQRDLNITFFVVGQDAALEKNADAIRSIANAGHEIGNHSFNHEPWLHTYSKDQIAEEIDKTTDAIEGVTGHRPVGFRAPGFSLSDTVLEVLSERKYEYDCSALPTYTGPLARAFYRLSSRNASDEDREKHKNLFGKFSDGFRTLKPHAITGGMIEIPVTTFPFVKLPIHVTYLMYLSSFSPGLARAYWKAAITACRLTGTQPSLLLHPLDFLGGDELPELNFFPGMNIPSEKKADLLNYIIELLQQHFDVVTVRQHAKAAATSIAKTLPDLELKNA